jgi:hypothetical protein
MRDLFVDDLRSPSSTAVAADPDADAPKPAPP